MIYISIRIKSEIHKLLLQSGIIIRQIYITLIIIFLVYDKNYTVRLNVNLGMLERLNALSAGCSCIVLSMDCNSFPYIMRG